MNELVNEIMSFYVASSDTTPAEHRFKNECEGLTNKTLKCIAEILRDCVNSMDYRHNVCMMLSEDSEACWIFLSKTNDPEGGDWIHKAKISPSRGLNQGFLKDVLRQLNKAAETFKLDDKGVEISNFQRKTNGEWSFVITFKYVR